MLGNEDVPQLGCTVREAPAGNSLRTLEEDGGILIMLGNEGDSLCSPEGDMDPDMPGNETGSY